jgi:energy-coupling factor transporter transmembrane protein EcfT
MKMIIVIFIFFVQDLTCYLCVFFNIYILFWSWKKKKKQNQSVLIWVEN